MLFCSGFLYTKKMADMKEQRACIKFCFTMGRNAMGKYEVLHLLESGQLEEHKFLYGFPRSKAACVC